MVREQNLSAVLSDFARTMVTDFPVQDILDRLVDRIVEILPVTSSGVTLIEPGLAPRYVAASDAGALRFEKLQTANRQGPCVLAYHSGVAVSVPHLGGDRRFPMFAEAAEESGLVAVFAFPLNHGSSRLGALDLYRDTVGDLDPDDLAAAQTLADVAAAYLINAQAREDDQVTTARFEASALHDPLTGLPNRVLLDQRLVHAAQRAVRGHTSAAVLFADLDRFKDINDAYGHQAGDQLLAAVADRLSGVLRPGDTVARVSGDEFVFLCEDLAHPRDAEILSNRIRSAFISPFSLDVGEITISASVGVAFAGPGEEISGHLVAKADSAMYRAKRDRGRRQQQVVDLRDPASPDLTVTPDTA